jgi:hypothetical protein
MAFDRIEILLTNPHQSYIISDKQSCAFPTFSIGGPDLTAGRDAVQQLEK